MAQTMYQMAGGFGGYGAPGGSTGMGGGGDSPWTHMFSNGANGFGLPYGQGPGGFGQQMQPQMPGSSPFGAGQTGSSLPGYPMPQPQQTPPSSGVSTSGNVPLSQRPIGTLYGNPLYPGQTGQTSQPAQTPGVPGGGWGSMSSSQQWNPNPAYDGMVKGITQSFNNNLTRNVLPAIQSQANAVGGVGGARQGIAQGLAIGDSQSGLANALANLGGQTYEADMNRALQGYGMDQNYALGNLNSDRNYGLGLGGLSNQRYGMDQNYNLGQGQLGLGWFNGQNQYNLGQQANQNQANQIANNYALGNQGQQLDFYSNQRGQDIQQYLAGLQGFNYGMQGPWNALNNYGNMLGQYAGNGTTSQNTSQGGGAMGAAGGALGVWQLLNLMNQGGG